MTIDASPATRGRQVALILSLATLLLAPLGCGGRGKSSVDQKRKDRADNTKIETVKIVKPERRDLRISVVQPGTIQSYEVTPIYSRISGYVDRYRANIGDRVNENDVLIKMFIPDMVEALAQKTAAMKRADVQIPVAEAILKSNEARYQTSIAAVVSAEAGVRRSQANYDRWDSEYRRIKALAASRVLDEQVRDETYKQFEEAVAAKDQAISMVAEAVANRDRAAADRDKAKVDIDAARADLEVARADTRLAQVMVDFGTIRAPYAGVITQRNVNPGDYLQPGGGSMGSPLYVLEQINTVRIFVGVPELFSGFIHDGDTADIRVQALPGRSFQGKVIRSGYSLNPTNRTMQAEVDIPNPDGILRAGMYVNVSITVDRSKAFTVPSPAVRFQGQTAYIYLVADGKAKMTPVQVGPADDRYTEILRKHGPDSKLDTWLDVDGNEPILVGSMDAMSDGMSVPQEVLKPSK